jgi:Protein of unknown function (DUF2442)
MDVSATRVSFDDHRMWVDCTDGRILGVPIAFFPRLLNATPEQRARVQLSPNGLLWEEIAQEISVAGLRAAVGEPKAKD